MGRAMEAAGRVDGVDQVTGTAELTKMIRKTGEALDAAMRAPNADYFAPRMEALRGDCLELFRRLIVRSPYAAHRKDAISKMWFRAIYPSIEQYRANIRQFEAAQGSAHASETAEVRRELAKWRARFQTFLQAAAGILQRLVAELSETQGLAAAGAVQGAALDHRTLSTLALGYTATQGLRTELQAELTQTQHATLALIARVLTHLGDLARYRAQHGARTQRPDAWQVAKGFYCAAIRLAPQRGQAHNQLAVIFGYERNSVDGVFAYYRALSAQHRFASAAPNLRAMLDSAVRAVEAPQEDAAAAVGYVQSERSMYPGFTRLRYLFAFCQPELQGPAAEAQLVANARMAAAIFVKRVAAGNIGERPALMAHAIHLLELQQLGGLSTDGTSLQPHEEPFIRLSALFVADVAAGLCRTVAEAVRGCATEAGVSELTDAGVQRSAGAEVLELLDARVQGIPGADVLELPGARALPTLVQTVLWLVTACVRVNRDASSRDSLAAGGGPVSQPTAQVLAALGGSELMAAMMQLQTAMERRKIVADGSILRPVLWEEVRASTDVVELLVWRAATSDARQSESELLSGWQLPDGSVWGRCPPQRDELRSGGGADNSRWGLLQRLLPLALEALPPVLALVAAQSATEPEELSDMEPEESETICFHGRPQRNLAGGSPLVDAERDEVVGPSAMRAQPSRGAIGSQRIGPVASTALSDQGAEPGLPYSAQTGLAHTPAHPQQYGHSAIHAWQQYQLEHQRKQQMQMQLEHQQAFQQQTIQNNLHQRFRQPSVREVRSFDLDATTASVLNMALSTPCDSSAQPATSLYCYDHPLYTGAPALPPQPTALGPPLHPSLSLSSLGSSVPPWMSPYLPTTTHAGYVHPHQQNASAGAPQMQFDSSALYHTPQMRFPMPAVPYTAQPFGNHGH
ncbi:hypothetical protein COEREDRAFT_7530 [Coemansia reversa NRRL 1564]|uniref:DNA/RNA-binding domain-containing protein n=1 Tax=Coemansia reversa (strain ATCC 12441 / NRRL 1564) TaxID=763665 RepID=A0A2G5BFS0_COERN|nr:hypothetical protein COEREDRAFT_7530 [Coemansia reversa NRRL 1564]|eukprot:PIA17567.1 hypothetical protein COEREDRAFT_7530 [Coemansia reversa NRRL 1564]